MELPSRTVIGVGLLVLGLIFFLYMMGIIEGFDDVTDAAAARSKQTGYAIDNQMEICLKKTSCGSCLDEAGCGWCPGARKCVTKVNRFPIVPLASSADVTADTTNTLTLNAPLFTCPVESTNPAEKFVARKDQCLDLTCSSFTSCRDCAGNVACGWCASSKKCFTKTSAGFVDAEGATVCATATDRITTSGNCPVSACKDITDCGECTSTPGCSFCETAKKCVRFQERKDMAGKVVEEKSAAVNGCDEETALSTPSQCPSVRDLLGSTPLRGSDKNRYGDVEPSDTELASAQDNSVGGWNGQPAEQAVTSTEGPVSPADSSDVVTAPGVVRRAGARSRHPSFPAAAGLDGLEGGPFESYVKMLVKSELAGLGVAEAAAEGFQAAAAPANAPLGAMVANATKQVQESLRKVFTPHGGVRIA